MKRISLLLISTIGFIASAKADTIDYWHVYYNDIKIKEYNQYAKDEIVLKIKDIKKSDTLTIKYFRDTPCRDCLTQVSIEPGDDSVITKGRGIGTFNPVKVPLFDLILKANGEFCNVYYYEEGSKHKGKILLFRIKIE